MSVAAPQVWGHRTHFAARYGFHLSPCGTWPDFRGLLNASADPRSRLDKDHHPIESVAKLPGKLPITLKLSTYLPGSVDHGWPNVARMVHSALVSKNVRVGLRFRRCPLNHRLGRENSAGPCELRSIHEWIPAGSLTDLDLSICEFVHGLAEALPVLSSLVHLDISGATRFGTLADGSGADQEMRTLSRLTKLTSLIIGSGFDIQVTDAGLEALSCLTALTELRMRFFALITDNGWRHLQGLKLMRVLALSASSATDAGLLCLCNMPSDRA